MKHVCMVYTLYNVKCIYNIYCIQCKLYLFFTQLFDTKKYFPPPVDLDQSTIDTLRKELEKLYPNIYEKSCKTKGHFAKQLADWERIKLAK
jgi:hypothetical protein